MGLKWKKITELWPRSELQAGAHVREASSPPGPHHTTAQHVALPKALLGRMKPHYTRWYKQEDSRF